MRFALLSYSNTKNIGDNIQTLAVEQHVEQEYTFVDRDFMHQYDGEPVVVVMNGWFTHEPENWPPSSKITPIFFGFHLIPSAAKSFEKHRDYFRRFAPIGCRDHATAEIVRSWGVEAYVSGCATMTFPTRDAAPANPKVLLVDQSRGYFPKKERREYIRISQSAPSPYLSNKVKLELARELLDFYRQHAGRVVTKRIHCAMPCAAMGIPVTYTGKKDGRTAIIDMIGIQSAKPRLFPRTRLAKLPVTMPAFDEVKARIIADLHKRLVEHGIKVRQPN